MKDKNYFVITTNVDSQFTKAGFDPDKIFEVQGNYGELQCAKPCHSQVYDNETLVQKWRSQQKNCQIPTALVPKCPVCGGKMAMHLRVDHRFVETEQWHTAQQRYAAFAEQASVDKGPLRARVVADFIAGMTDRFAAREHERLTGRRLLD